MAELAFRIRQNGTVVAKVTGDAALVEILHYADQYRQDGGVTIQHNAAGHWKSYAALCQWPPAEHRT